METRYGNIIVLYIDGTASHLAVFTQKIIIQDSLLDELVKDRRV